MDEAGRLLELAEKNADTLLGLTERERADLRVLAAQLRRLGVRA